MLSLSEMEGHKVLIACTKSQSTLDLYRAYLSTHSGALINLKDPSETGDIVWVKESLLICLTLEQHQVVQECTDVLLLIPLRLLTQCTYRGGGEGGASFDTDNPIQWNLR